MPMALTAGQVLFGAATGTARLAGLALQVGVGHSRLVAQRPVGTVTFLFSDVAGSTRLLQELGDEYPALLGEHRRRLRAVFERHGGVEVGTEGDSFFVVFSSAAGAVLAAGEAQQALAGGRFQVRIGLHTGEGRLSEDDYVGIDVHRAARIAAAGHGGQVLLSRATRELVEADVRDLGDHRLKDLAGPERLYQLGQVEHPPLKSLYQTNLPVPVTPFLGRQRELGEIAALLGRGEVRLVTLTGPGGSGKTRLAAQAAAEVGDEYPDGVWWVALAALRDPQAVLETTASALGTQSSLGDYLAGKRLLLLLDNFEQVLAAAGAVAGLMAACPGLDLLVTSREPLRVEAEWEYAVEPLRVEEAVALFCQRAARSAASSRRMRALSVSAYALIACRWRSSWPPRAASSCPRRRCWRASSSVCRCSPAARVTRPPASKRCAPLSPGATTCSRLASSACSRACRSLSAALPSRPPKASARLTSTRSPH